jgi:hypothetical protein
MIGSHSKTTMSLMPRGASEARRAEITSINAASIVSDAAS